MDRQRLHARLRRLSPPRWTCGGSLREAAAVRRRRGRVHRSIAPERAGVDLERPHRRSSPARTRRCARLTGRTLHRDDDLCGGPRANASARRLERDRSRRWRGRARRRRVSHRRAVVALGLLHQPADRDRRGHPRASLRAELARCPAARDRRRRRCGVGHGRAARPRLRHRQGAGVRLDLGPHARACGTRRAPARRLRRDRAPLACSADPALHLPHPFPDGSERGDALRHRRPLRDVLLRVAVRAGRAGLQPAEGGSRISAGDRGDRDRRRRSRRWRSRP